MSQPAPLVPHICELFLRTGQLAKAQAYLVEAQSIMGRPADWCGLEGDFLLAEGMIAAAHGHWQEAELAFQRAIDVYQQYLLPWDEAKVCYEWATELLGQ